MIITLKQKGVDIDSANKYLNQAKTAIEIKEFKKAILFASKAKMTAKKLQAQIPKQPEPIEESPEASAAESDSDSEIVDDTSTPQMTPTEEEVTNPNMTNPQ